MRRAASGDPTATLTHARLRIAQGDLRSARRVLRSIPEHSPHHREAQDLLRSIAGRADRAERPPADEAPEPRRAAGAAELAGRFKAALGRRPVSDAERKIERLRAWLARVQAGRRPPRA